MTENTNNINSKAQEYLLKLSNLTQTEKEEIKITAQIAASIIKARSENNITQQKLADMSGVDRVVVSRTEKCKTDHRISTIIKLLSSIGKTLAIVPIEK